MNLDKTDYVIFYNEFLKKGLIMLRSRNLNNPPLLSVGFSLLTLHYVKFYESLITSVMVLLLIKKQEKGMMKFIEHNFLMCNSESVPMTLEQQLIAGNGRLEKWEF